MIKHSNGLDVAFRAMRITYSTELASAAQALSRRDTAIAPEPEETIIDEGTPLSGESFPERIVGQTRNPSRRHH